MIDIEADIMTDVTSVDLLEMSWVLGDSERSAWDLWLVSGSVATRIW